MSYYAKIFLGENYFRSFDSEPLYATNDDHGSYFRVLDRRDDKIKILRMNGKLSSMLIQATKKWGDLKEYDVCIHKSPERTVPRYIISREPSILTPDHEKQFQEFIESDNSDDFPPPEEDPWESLEKFTLFWKSPLSQWDRTSFKIGGQIFNCAEQCMMYLKASLFHDLRTAQKILYTNSPSEQKKLGRTVLNFNPIIWDMFKEGIVYTANYAKFSQNEELRKLLFATRGTTLVEASPEDCVWGIGLAADHPDAKDRSKWRGQNLLGEILTNVRESLLYSTQARKLVR